LRTVPEFERMLARSGIHHLLSQMPYEEVELPVIELPQRERQKDYSRGPVPQEIIVPEVY
jgi:hypothetical protein